MKYFLPIIFATIISFASPLYAQQNQGEPVKEKYYMEIKGIPTVMSRTTVKTSLVMGKIIPVRTGLTQEEEKRIAKMMVFDYMADAMNFLSVKGWTLEDTYIIPLNGTVEYRWVVSKTVSDPMELLEGFFENE